MNQKSDKDLASILWLPIVNFIHFALEVVVAFVNTVMNIQIP